MYTHTTIRALQQERYLRKAKERRSDIDAPTDGRRLRRLLTMVVSYRIKSGSPIREPSEAPSKVGVFTVSAVMALGLGFGVANWPESPALRTTPAMVSDRAAEAQLAQNLAKVEFLTEQYETRSGTDPLRGGPKSPLTAE